MTKIAILFLSLTLLTQDWPSIESDPGNSGDQFYIDSLTWQIRSLDDGSAEGLAMLTIDDGPKAFTTPGFLDLLDEYNAKALFFINGYLAEALPWIVREILDRGHMVGNHTWGHKRLREISPESTEKEILKMNDWLHDVKNYKPRFFRAPYGDLTPEAETVIDQAGLENLNWSVNSYDWQFEDEEETIPTDARKIAKRTVEGMKNGNIILLHDRAVSLAALELILEELTEKGYKFVLPAD